MAKIKTTLTADDCLRFGANLNPTNRVKLSFPNTEQLIGLIASSTDANGVKTSNVQWAENRLGDVAPLDAVRKCQTRILWMDGCLISDTEAVSEEELRWAERFIQEKLEWI